MGYAERLSPRSVEFIILSAIQVSKRQKLLINYKNVFLFSAAVFSIFYVLHFSVGLVISFKDTNWF